MNFLTRTILDYLFIRQDTCYICLEERADSYICESCLERLEFIDGCHEIDKGTVLYPLFYNNLMKDLVKSFKFQEKTYLSKPFGLILYEYIKTKKDLLSVDYISYVAMDRRSNFKRGYNQAKLLAEEVSFHTGIELVKIVDKVRPTKEQNKIGLRDRRVNLLGSYRPIKGLDLDGKSVLFIDDLVTSGNTLEACRQVILDEYDCHLYFLTLASSKLEDLK